MSTSTCCVCRWVGTLATANSACPKCGEKSWADGVSHAATFRTVRPEAPHLGVEEGVAPVVAWCSVELTQGLSDLSLATGTSLVDLGDAAQALVAANPGMTDEEVLAAFRGMASAWELSEKDEVLVTENDSLLEVPAGEPPAGTPLTEEERAVAGYPPLAEGTDAAALEWQAKQASAGEKPEGG